MAALSANQLTSLQCFVVSFLAMVSAASSFQVRPNFYLASTQTLSSTFLVSSSKPFVGHPQQQRQLQMSSDWSDFSALDDDDELDELKVDTRDYAVEDDSQEAKAEAGAAVEGPEIENDAPPIDVPAGTCLHGTKMHSLVTCKFSNPIIEEGILFGFLGQWPCFLFQCIRLTVASLLPFFFSCSLIFLPRTLQIY